MSDGSSDSNMGTNPTEKKLIEQYDKYPEYLKVSFKRPNCILDYTEPLNASNRFSIANLLNKQSKDQLLERISPFCLYIQLVPELNILTVSVGSENESVTTDTLF